MGEQASAEGAQVHWFKTACVTTVVLIVSGVIVFFIGFAGRQFLVEDTEPRLTITETHFDVNGDNFSIHSHGDNGRRNSYDEGIARRIYNFEIANNTGTSKDFVFQVERPRAYTIEQPSRGDQNLLLLISTDDRCAQDNGQSEDQRFQLHSSEWSTRRPASELYDSCSLSITVAATHNYVNNYGEDLQFLFLYDGVRQSVEAEFVPPTAIEENLDLLLLIERYVGIKYLLIIGPGLFLVICILIFQLQKRINTQHSASSIPVAQGHADQQQPIREASPAPDASDETAD